MRSFGSFLGLPSGYHKLEWLRAARVYYLSILDAGDQGSRCWQEGTGEACAPGPSPALNASGPPWLVSDRTSLWLFTQLPVAGFAHTFLSSWEDPRGGRLGPTLVTSLCNDDLCTGARCWELAIFSIYLLIVVGSSEIGQPVTDGLKEYCHLCSFRSKVGNYYFFFFKGNSSWFILFSYF